MNGVCGTIFSFHPAHDARHDNKLVGFGVGQQAVRLASATLADSNRGRPRDRDRTRQAIVEAALRLAEASGKASLSLSGIAAEAGFATGTVYGYFRTKQDLLQSAFGEEALPEELNVGPMPVASPLRRMMGGPALENRSPSRSNVTHGPGPRHVERLDAQTETSIEGKNPPTPKSQQPDEAVIDTVESLEPAKTTLRRSDNTALPKDAASGVMEKRRAILAKPDKERSHLDAIIDRLVVPPASTGNGFASVSRFERRIDLFESELAKLASQQASFHQQCTGLEASAGGNAALFTAKLDGAEQRRLKVVAELRGEILELSLRVKALENGHRAGSGTDPSAAVCDLIANDSAVLTALSDAIIEKAAPSVGESGDGSLQTYLSMARQSANNAAAATATGNSEERRNDIKRYLLLGGVAVAALVVAVAALGNKQPTRVGSGTAARHTAHPSTHRVVHKTATVISPPAIVVDRRAESDHAESVLPESQTETNQNARQGAEQNPLQRTNGQSAKENPAGPAREVGNDHMPLDQVSALAQAGNAKAQLAIGLKYLSDSASFENRSRAKHWLELAAAKGLPVAQYRLGTVYQHGLAGSANAAKAMRWYEAAASQGNVKAMYNLAFGHAEGWSGSKNYAEAARWYSAAARLGYVDAQFNLAILYERGEGVPQSLLDAYKWYSIAAQNGDVGAAKRVEMIAPQLSASEILAGRVAITGFHPEQQNKTANTVPQLSGVSSAHG